MMPPPANDLTPAVIAYHDAAVDRFFSDNVPIAKMRHVGGAKGAL